MPPKRKAATAATGEPKKSTRTTRSSTAASSSKKTAKTIQLSSDDDPAPAPPAAKMRKASTRTTKAAAPAKKATAKGSTSRKKAAPAPAVEEDDEEVKVVSPKKQKYHASAAQTIFKKYADEDDVDLIAAEGLERLCTDAKISMEGLEPIVLGWSTGSKQMGEIRSEGFLNFLAVHKIASLDALAKQVVKDTKALGGGEKWKDFYAWLFNWARGEQKSLDIDMVKPLWALTLPPRYGALGSELVEFLESKEKLKGLTKDSWNMVGVFLDTVQPDLGGYDESAAWPSLIDEFVEWKREKKGGGGGGEKRDEDY